MIAYDFILVSLAFLVFILVLLAMVIYLAVHIARGHKNEIKKKDEELEGFKRVLAKREHTYKQILEIAHYVALNMDFEKTLQGLLPKVLGLTKSNCCAFYTVNNASRLALKHSIGFGKNIYQEFDLSIGEGFIGNLALKEEITVIYDVPDDTIYTVRTFLGKIKPRNVMVVPIFHESQLSGVMVCASINAYTEDEQALVEMIRNYLGVAVGNGINAEKTRRMSGELEFQNKLIQNQHEEMQKRLEEMQNQHEEMQKRLEEKGKLE